jgi:hypothetical protein
VSYNTPALHTSNLTIVIADATGTPIYTIDALLALAHSPASRLPLETREALRTSFPDIITNRKQRKTIEYHNNINSGPRRTQHRPERRRNATRVLDGAAVVEWQRHTPAPLMVA